MAQLVFEIKDQWISRTDTFKPVAKSKNYLYAQFNFLTDEWVGVPTAIFRNKTSAYEQIIGQDGTCLVPWEVIDVEGDSEIFVSVFCGDLVTANKARVHVYDTGYGDDLESDTPPTPSVYEQILNRMAGIEEDMDDATQRAESAAESAEYAAEHYPIIMDEYWYVWDVIEHEYVDTNIKAEAHDGTSATVEVEQIVGGHRVIITDVSGEHIFDVPDGRDGTDGRGIASLEKTSTSGDVDQYTMTFSDGSEPFVYYVTNGASATISTRAITNGYRLTITDKNGTRAIDVLNGAQGDPGNGIRSIDKIGSYENYDYYEIRMTNGNKTSFTVTNGYSPTVEIVNITGGHRVIITDTNGAHSFDVMDGEGGGGVAIHICSSSEYDHTTGVPTVQNPEENTFYLVPSSESATHDMFVEWVYVNNAWEMFGSASIDLSQYATKTELNGKVDKVTGKSLSTNDYTTEEKNKLSGIEAQANKTVVDDALSSTSTNPVQNKKVKEALDNLDAGDIAYDDTETYSEGSVGDGLSSVKAEINQLDEQINGAIGGNVDVTSSVVWESPGGVNYSNGVIVSSITTFSHADIPLNGATHVSGYTRAGLEPEKAMCFLGANDTWISGHYNQGGASYNWNYSFDVPEGAMTLRLCCATSYLNDFTCVLTMPGSEGLEDRVETLEQNPPISNYEDLTNKPSINNVALLGDKSLSDFGIASESNLNELDITVNGGQTTTETDIPLSSFIPTAFRIMSNGYWATQSNGGYVIELPSDVTSIKITGNETRETYFAFLSAFAPVNGTKAPIVGSIITVPINGTVSENVTTETKYLFVSRQNSSGYNIAPQSVKSLSVGIEIGIVKKLDAFENGNTVEYTGSYYQIRTGDFKKGTCWRLLLSDTNAEYVEINGLTDASDMSTAEFQFVLNKGKETLWSPLKDFEAIKYGVNGSCKLSINDCSSIYDEIERNVFYCGASRKYKKLIDAIEAAERYMGAVLYVDAGTYDLVEEFGDDYFANLSSSSSMPGIVLKNRIHIVFSPNSFVECHYTGNNQYALINFSPFNTGQYGFTLENLNLDSSRTRYAIHDERNGKVEQCVSRYINCNIKQDNSNNAEWSSYCCIGGGLGSNHEVMIENCTFESIPRSGVVVHGAVSYHPSNDASNHDFRCEIVMKNNYFKTGTLELSGSRTDATHDTTCIITGNSLEYNSGNSASGIYYSGNQQYQGSHYKVYAWNNEIRQ